MTRARVWFMSDIDLLEAFVIQGLHWHEIGKVLGKTPASCKAKAAALGMVHPGGFSTKRRRKYEDNLARKGVNLNTARAPAAPGPAEEHEARDEMHVERCLAGGGFVWREKRLGEVVEHWPRLALSPWRGGVQ